jgi:RNA polymerase sigma factor (TIGR02999 family)
MQDDVATEVTRLLGDIREGDKAARDRLFAVVYQELRGLAGALFAPHRHRNTLQPTALVHEAWLKLVGHLDSLECRRHFFSVAAKAMRQVLADRVRDAKRQKRGGSRETIVLQKYDAVEERNSSREVDMIDLDDKLTKLFGLNERYARVVEMRLLGSMTVQEIADELEVSKRTVEGDWTFARAWLRRELQHAQ